MPVRQMKILYHHRIGSLDGGEIVHAQELVWALERLGHEVIVVGPVDIMRAGFDQTRTERGAGWSRFPAWLRETIELGYAFFAFVRLWLAFLWHRPDVIYERANLFFPASAWLRRLLAAPLLLEVNAPLAQERSEHGRLSFKRLAHWSERASWRAADHLLPVSQVLADRLIRTGVPRGRITVVPNGVRLEALPDDPEAKRRLGLEGKTVLGFVGFVRDWHRLDQILHLLREPDAANLHLLVVGGGPDFPALRRTVRNRGLEDRVTLTGTVPRHRIPAYISAFDIALQAGVTSYASPLKLFEYMALGKAIVAPDQANIREILADGQNALLFDPARPEGLRRAVERLRRDPDLRQRLGQAARRALLARDYTWDANARRVAEIAAALAGGRRSAGG